MSEKVPENKDIDDAAARLDEDMAAVANMDPAELVRNLDKILLPPFEGDLLMPAPKPRMPPR